MVGTKDEMRIIGYVSKMFLKKHKNIKVIWSVQDLVGEGFLHLEIIRKRYKPEYKVKYTSYLYNSLNYHFMDITRNDRKGLCIDWDTNIMDEIFIKDLSMDFPPSFLAELSSEAKMVITFLSDIPGTFISFIGERSSHISDNQNIGDFLHIPRQRMEQIRVELENKIQ